MRSPSIIALLAATALTSGCQTVESHHIDGEMTSTLPSALSSAPLPPPAAPDLNDGGDCADGAALCPGATVAAVDPASVHLQGGRAAPQRSESLRSPVPDGDGLIYFLPRQLVKVTAKRTSKLLKDAIAEVKKAQTALDGAKASVAALEREVATVRARRVAEAANPAALAVLTPYLEQVEKALTDAKAAQKTAETSLTGHETTLSTLRATGGDAADKLKTVTLTMEMLPMSADPAYGFRLRPRHMPQRDDEHKFTVAANGLLTSTDIVATDRTGDILVELGGIVGALAGFRAGTPTAAVRGSNALESCANTPDEVISVVDFSDERETDQLAIDLACHGLRLIVAERPPLHWGTGIKRDKVPGIAIRMPVEIPIRIEQCTSDICNLGDFRLREIRYVSLPQAGPTSFVRQDAGVFTKTKYTLGFKDGILVSYDANRPSEILAIASTPLKVIDSLFSSFSKIISLRTGRNDELVALSASDLAKFIALSSDQAAAAAFSKCVALKSQTGEPAEACIPKE